MRRKRVVSERLYRSTPHVYSTEPYRWIRLERVISFAAEQGVLGLIDCQISSDVNIG
jgi:hypothetical protein